jgi:hypothetical protein
MVVVEEIIERLPDPDPRMRKNWRTTGHKVLAERLAKMIPESYEDEEESPRRRKRQ